MSPNIDYCMGAADAYRRVGNDLFEMIELEQEDWREAIIDYTRYCNEKVQSWLDEALIVLKEGPYYE